jgi:iron only hydrogenase large subunit-like protein/transposase-like protein
MELIVSDKERCVGCNVCIRACPCRDANRIVVTDDGRNVTEVDPDCCIMCGACIKACKHNARDYIDDTEKFMTDLNNAEKIVLVVSPAIKTSLPEMWQGLLDWLKAQGIFAVYDASFGADIMTWAYAKHLEMTKNNKGIVSAVCPSLVDYIEKYNHPVVDNIMPIWSPEVCEAIYLKEYLHVPYSVAVISPCIAKKVECMTSEIIDYSVTIKRVYEYALSHKAKMRASTSSDVLYKFDDQQGIMGGMFPRDGGLRDNIWLYDAERNVVSVGGATIFKELDLYGAMPQFKRPELFDVLSCENGCNCGPGSCFSGDIFDVMTVMKYVENEAKERRKFPKNFITGKKEDAQRKFFDETLDYKKFNRTFAKQRRTALTPTDKELNDIFVSMGKNTPEQQHFDCHSCGYDSCREMASAIVRGINTRNNCIQYAKNALSSENQGLEQKLEQINHVSESVSSFAEKIMSDIESIYAALSSIDKNHAESDKYVNIIIGILEKIIDMCRTANSIEASDLPTLVNTLTTLQNALMKLRESFTTTVTNSNEIRTSMRIVADASVSLNATVGELIVELA